VKAEVHRFVEDHGKLPWNKCTFCEMYKGNLLFTGALMR